MEVTDFIGSYRKAEEYISHSEATVSNVAVKDRLPVSFECSNIPKSTLEINEDKCVTLDDDVAWSTFFALQNNASTNSTNSKPFARGKNKYNGKDIICKIADQIKEEISKGIENNAIEFIRLKEAKRENDIVYPSTRVVLNDNEKEVNIMKLLSGNACKKYNVKTITSCHPNKNKTRGLCCYINDNGERVYEVINGSYDITLSWYVEDNKCKIKININDDGTIKILEGNGITQKQLLANKEVKVGKKCEAKPLHEALASQLLQK